MSLTLQNVGQVGLACGILNRKIMTFLDVRKAEEMAVPDWSMIGMTITSGKLIGNDIINPRSFIFDPKIDL